MTVPEGIARLREVVSGRDELMEVVEQLLSKQPQVAPPVDALEARCRRALVELEFRAVQPHSPNITPPPTKVNVESYGCGFQVSPMAFVQTEPGLTIGALLRCSRIPNAHNLWRLLESALWHACSDANWQPWVELLRLCKDGNWPICFVPAEPGSTEFDLWVFANV